MVAAEIKQLVIYYLLNMSTVGANCYNQLNRTKCDNSCSG